MQISELIRYGEGVDGNRGGAQIRRCRTGRPIVTPEEILVLEKEKNRPGGGRPSSGVDGGGRGGRRHGHGG